MVKNTMDQNQLDSYAKECQKLVDSHKTLSLSTLSESGHPEISYTPFIRSEEGEFYIFISELAHHTANLLLNPKCSILFAVPESETRNLFARERAFFNCTTEEVERGCDAFNVRLDQFQEAFGNTVELLRSMSDFHLFKLTPFNGQYTVGFGKAFTINNDGSLTHIVIDKKK
ncbi:pyridoxamine 5-phosphate oxidase [Endozoicomonas sp. OPT23]|uniref:HugZ family pyridoxamine 5'-phosphate oxidase n=1 Tax=Endozoicomonas sp. OPT23 TaxID=2072845 RepID=UPI00129AD82B|nr:pyridoxamine 5'-phosphate oxidase family protein [Endozoicomonas sp. OPT23]MRI33093.1 pyridoxamine 5-phosphate oxidase [Endozoicomonas sp. OPT23]